MLKIWYNKTTQKVLQKSHIQEDPPMNSIGFVRKETIAHTTKTMKGGTK